MKKRITRMILLLCFVFGMVLPVAAEENLARQVLVETNLARTEPGKYADFIRESRSHYDGKIYRLPGVDTFVKTHEGVAALDEAIEFLSRQKPLPALDWSQGLAAAAAELVRKQSKSGNTGHGGEQTGTMQERIERHGTILQGVIGENIAYGPSDPRRMVMQLIIDDGVPDRGHRKNMYNSQFDSAGIACGPHPDFGTMCVINFAKGFRAGDN
ncbi:MAG: CAP domain-containing protein [Desulforhopalus sp.]